jgi:hypothetical protein
MAWHWINSLFFNAFFAILAHALVCLLKSWYSFSEGTLFKENPFGFNVSRETLSGTLKLSQCRTSGASIFLFK